MTLPPFQQLVDAYWRDVARLCAALAGPDLGEDAAQRAWLRALRAYPSLRHTRNLRGWVLTIASRAAIDEHRARRRRAVPTDELPDNLAAAGAPSGDGALWERVRELPARQRTAVGLHYLIGLSHAEVAQALSTTPEASRRLVSDALGALRRALAEEVRT